METGKVVKFIIMLVVIMTLLVFILGFKDTITGMFDGAAFKNLFQFNLGFQPGVGGGGSGGGIIGGGGQGGSGSGGKIISNLPEGFEEGDISQYYGRVSVSANGSARPYDSNSPSRININVSGLDKGEAVNVTGWKIESNDDSMRVPQAISDFPGSLAIVPEEDIWAVNQDRITIYSTRSSINRNVRTNKCFGAVQNQYNFEPRVSSSCPTIDRSQFVHLSGKCQNYISGKNYCSELKATDLNKLDGECRREIRGLISYNACYERYHNDENFFSHEWYVWANRNILDQYHDRVRLYDSQGKLVDEYIY